MSTGQSEQATTGNQQGTDLEMLHHLQEETFKYFTEKEFSKNGLIADKTQPGSPASIAVIGLGLSCYPAGVERGFISRSDAVRKTLEILHFLDASHQGPEPDATGYKGFFYHFLDMDNGKRVWKCELSTMDTAILMAGVLTATHYFTLEHAEESEIRKLGDELYRRVDWQWAMDGQSTLCHGWTPENGFLNFSWRTGYSEAHILYILAMGSPTYPINKSAYTDWISTFEWKNIYDIELAYAGPLFIHQLSQFWLRFQGISDDFNRRHNIDYFENSRRAVYIQQQYAIKNPLGFERYGQYGWGISACDGPGPTVRTVKGIERRFFDYIARGVPYGPDDGTICPWAFVASLPFAPEIVLDTIRHAIERLKLMKTGNRGFHASFNATYPDKGENSNGWVSKWQFGLNQGPVVMMIENYRTGLIWNILSKCDYIVNGLVNAGFTGGWLDEAKK